MRFASKRAFREFCKKRLLRKSTSYEVVVSLAWLIEKLGVRSLLLYLPMAHEPDVLALLKKLRSTKHLFVPFMEGESFKMVKFRYPLKRGAFGIKQPPNSFLKTKIDAVVVPVLGVDGDFRRVGFGKGMYDRFFASLEYRPVVIFVQNQKCFTDQRVGESHDVQGDFLITPKEILIRGDSDVGRNFGRKFCRHFKWRCRVYARKKNRKG